MRKNTGTIKHKENTKAKKNAIRREKRRLMAKRKGSKWGKTGETKKMTMVVVNGKKRKMVESS